MKKLLVMLSVLFLLAGTASADWFLDFEDGADGAEVTDISGVSFESFNGFHPIYGDSRTGNWNTTSDDLGYGSGAYHHNGNFFVFSSTAADARGMIVDFDNNDGTFFSTGYSSSSIFYVEAYLTDGSMVSVSGAGNLRQPMGRLTVNATAGTFIDYIVLHDSGNYWLVDDMRGDASDVGGAVPEPATFVLFGLGMIGLAGISRRKNA